MRIRQSVRFAAQRAARILLRKTTIATLGVVILTGGALIYQNLLTTPATSHAITPPDNCFAFNTTTGAITRYYNNEGDNIANPACPKNVDIPSSIGGIQVLVIGDRSFYESNLTALTIPEGVTTIEFGAFYKNQFSTAVIPNTVTSIDYVAFGYGKLASILIPESVTHIGDFAFTGNELTSVTIPSTITSIGDHSFSGNQLTSVTIPASLTSIGEGAFNSNELTSVIIPEGVTTIEDSTFAYNMLESLTIPDNVTSIGNNAFAGNRLASVTIPKNVTSLGWGAFRMNLLESITIPDTVTSVGSGAFEANQLTSVTLGCGVTSLADQQFAMNKLQEVIIPDCTTSIYPTAFFGQNPWGGGIDEVTEGNPNWYSSDPEVVKAAYDSLWYVRLYTADPSNPNNLIGGIANEDWYTGDITGDGDWSDSIGGHLINPASTTIHYVDRANIDVAPSVTTTGRLADGTSLGNYLVKNVEVPPIVDLHSLTAEESEALTASLSQYHQIGQSISLTAPTIAGYTLLSPASPRTFNLTNKNNAATFTYGVPSPNTTPAPGSPTTDSASSTARARSGISNPKTPVKVDGQASTHGEILSVIDFATPSGSKTNPTTGSVPSGLSELLAKSRLAVDETKSCNRIESAKLLSSTSFTAQAKNLETLGGLAFKLNCTTVGGDSAITFTLGSSLTDLTRMRIYKQNARGENLDITDQVSITNQPTASGTQTVVKYTIRDGQPLDDDNKEDGSISDPVFVTIKNDDTKPLADSRAQHKETAGALVAAAIMLGVSIVAIVMVRKKRRA